MEKRKLKFRWTCSDYRHHQHRWKFTAWLCGRWQYFMALIEMHNKEPDAWTLVLRCSDGFLEYQSYDTCDEAIQAGERQRSDYVGGYEIRPWFAIDAVARLKRERTALTPD